MSLSWMFLIWAILLDVAGTVCLKFSHGFTRWIPGVLTVFFYGSSLATFSWAMRDLQVGIAYALWAGMGTALVVAVGIVWFKEPATAMKMLSLALIIAGTVLLNLSLKTG